MKIRTPKRLLTILTAATLSMALLTGCGSDAETPQQGASSSIQQAAPQLDKEAYAAILAAGPRATDAEIAQSQWATAIKQAGVLRVGGTRTSYLFSQLDETDNTIRGFDAGLYQLLARYIIGDDKAYEIIQVDSSTREAVLTNKQADAVFATYSITPERQKVISFAGPYYTSQQAILVKKGNSTIKGIADLKGKTVATQSGSTGPKILAETAPETVVQEFANDTEARAALEQGRVDAYVSDYTLMLNAIAKNAGAYEIAGTPFGSKDNYGIGLPKNSDGVEFVNAFLKKIIADGSWAKLWTVSLGSRTGISTAPAAPEIK